MSEHPYITCRELIDFLFLYLCGELPPDRVSEFQRHLDVCPACVTYIETYRQTISLGKAAFVDPDAPVGEEVPEQLVQAILSVRPK